MGKRGEMGGCLRLRAQVLTITQIRFGGSERDPQLYR